MDVTETNGRVTRQMIAEQLRHRIIRGELGAGDRIPSRRDLSTQFRASSVTVQRAMEMLMRDGFAVASGAGGTFVSQHPPHLCRYGLVFVSAPTDDKWRRFNTVLVDQALRFESSTRRIAPYYGIHPNHKGTGNRQLASDLRGDRLAGLIIVGSPSDFAGTVVVDGPRKPCVLLMEEPGSSQFPAVGHDVQGFIDRSLDHLQSHGCRRLAMITGETGATMADYFRSQLARRSLEHRPYWLQGVHVSGPALARNLVHLLMHPGQDCRPDGLLVSDDNLVEHVLAGLRDVGVSSPGDLRIVVHANFPGSTPATMPLHRVGYDTGHTMNLCLDLIDQQLRGERVAPLTLVPAVSEDEFGQF